MAIPKTAPIKKSTVKKPATTKSKTAARTRSASAEIRPTVPPKALSGMAIVGLPSNIIAIVVAEITGTFILTMVALLPLGSGLSGSGIAIGGTLALLVIVIGNISGAHINPAVTFGLLTMHRLKPILAPLYWVSQILGAIIAVVVINAVANNSMSLSFANIGHLNWSIFGVELIGTAVFMFGIAAALARPELTLAARALTIGGSLFVGLLVAGSMLSAVQSDAARTYQEQLHKSQTDKGSKLPKTPEVSYVREATLNPVVALVVADITKNELATGTVGKNEHANSRLTLEVILGTLVGAALGGNLYILLAGRKNN